MVNLNTVIIFVGIILLHLGCMAQPRLPKRFRAELPNCCNRKIQSNLPFRTDGIYLETYEFDQKLSDSISLKWAGKPQTSKPINKPKKVHNSEPEFWYRFYIFYPDGTFFRTLSNFSNYDSVLIDILKKGEAHKVYSHKNFGDWGIYEFCNDTIYTITASKFPYYWGDLFKACYIIQGMLYN